MRKMIVRLAFLSLAFVFALSACGGATPTATMAPATAAPATAAPATAAPATAAPATVAPATAAATAAPVSTFPPIGTAFPSGTPLTIGMVLVGPYNDSGWSQATYEGGQYAASKIPNAKVIYVDNGFSHQGVTPAQLGEQLLAQGANLIIFNSDDFKDDSNTFAKAHPTVPTIMLSGDQSWVKGQAYLNIPNMVNIMPRTEYAKMIAGCAAAMTTATGAIGYLGPLINPETRRLASSAYLGAEWCWTNVLKKNAADLKFDVTWIGYWFNEPGTTLDPSKVADDFFNSGHDVVMSGIDTTEALTEAKKFHDAGKTVWAVSYDYINNCSTAPDVCLGVPYFNWGPGILAQAQKVVAGTFAQDWQWLTPDWTNINNPDTSATGFKKGTALSAAASSAVDQITAALASGTDLWTGPLNLQDGTVYLTAGTAATDQQIWYLPQLLQGMGGKSQ
jgi:simple sugar transport system substrate-binding protein